MKKSIKLAIAGLLAVPALAFGVAFSTPILQTASAQTANSDVQNGINAAQGSSTTSCLFTNTTGCTSGIFTNIVNILLYIIGAISVIMLIYGGIRYTISGGDSSAVTAAKNTILYAIVGLIVAVLAYAIVNFVLGVFVKS
jgi:hypothetical protein